MIKLSIIVPVYNTYKYLDRCLNSLVCQKNVKCDYEIIVVNDGTPDNSEEIILKYKKKYYNIIKYVKKENGGLASARNVGVKKAAGEYILFVDSDDFVDENLIETFLENNKNYDLFIYGYREIFECNSEKNENHVKKDIVISNNSFVNIMPYVIENKAIRGYAWNKFFKRSIIKNNNLYFDESIKYIEDLPFLVNYLCKAKKIYISSAILYNYMQRVGSLINSGFNPNKLTAIKGYKNIENIIFKNYKEYVYTFYYFFFELYYEISIKIKISNEFNKYMCEYKKTKNEMRRYFLKFILRNVNLKYKIKATIKLLFYNFLVMRY